MTTIQGESRNNPSDKVLEIRTTLVIHFIIHKVMVLVDFARLLHHVVVAMVVMLVKIFVQYITPLSDENANGCVIL